MTPRACSIAYQLGGSGQKPAQAYSLLGLRETRAWLEERLGPLVKFEVIEPERRPPQRASDGDARRLSQTDGR